MGAGDDIMASGMAKGAKARGKRIAFGDGRRIIWGPHSHDIFHNNPNVAPPGSEGQADIEWINYYRGNRIYSYADEKRWVWNYEFRTTPGEIFGLTEYPYCEDVVVIEPNVEGFKSSAPNRQWSTDRYQRVADILGDLGYAIIQPTYKGTTFWLSGVKHFDASFRNTISLIKSARLFIGPHGGLDHGAAAVGTPSVIIFGGWAPPSVVGYKEHFNIYSGEEACGSLYPCAHCQAALKEIEVDEVVSAAEWMLA